MGVVKFEKLGAKMFNWSIRAWRTTCKFDALDALQISQARYAIAKYTRNPKLIKGQLIKH